MSWLKRWCHCGAKNCIIQLCVSICELLSASLLEAPPNVNMSDQDDNEPQNSTECNELEGLAVKMKKRSRCQNDEMKERMRIR